MDQEEIDRNMRKLLELQQILSQRKAALEVQINDFVVFLVNYWWCILQQGLSDVPAAEKTCENAPDAQKGRWCSMRKTFLRHWIEQRTQQSNCCIPVIAH